MHYWGFTKGNETWTHVLSYYPSAFKYFKAIYTVQKKPVDNDRCMSAHVISSLFSALNFTFLYVINSQVMSCIDMLPGQVLI